MIMNRSKNLYIILFLDDFMNILYFANIDFYRKPNPSFHLMTAFISHFLSRGDSIYFVGREDPALDKHIPEEFATHPNFHYRLIKSSPAPKQAFARRYIEGVTFAAKARKYLKEFMPKADIVFLASTATVLFNALIVKSLRTTQK